MPTLMHGCMLVTLNFMAFVGYFDKSGETITGKWLFIVSKLCIDIPSKCVTVTD